MLSAVATALAPHGLNLVGAASVDAYDAGVPPAAALRALAPDAQTAIVVGNAGGAMWHAFRGFCRRHPGHDAGPDPLDRWTEHVVADAVPRALPDVPARILYPFRFATEPVSFMRLAACAGLGRAGLVGVLLHPVYGPWIALRAAILVPLAVDAPRPADGFDPCPTCTARACVAACPAGAVQATGWDVPCCARQRAVPDEPCATRCHARFECVIGREHRYPSDALAYHQRLARPAVVASGATPGAR